MSDTFKLKALLNIPTDEKYIFMHISKYVHEVYPHANRGNWKENSMILSTNWTVHLK